MSVTQRGALNVYATPDGLGLRFSATISAVGDLTAGAIIGLFTFNPWRDVWVIVDRWLAAGNNANTDTASFSAASAAFNDPSTWGTLWDSGPVDKLGTNGYWNFAKPDGLSIYLGRFSNGAANDMLQFAIQPNTNTKSYAFVVAGRMFFQDPGLGIKS